MKIGIQRPIKEIVAGLTFVGFGLAFALGAFAYPIGSPTRMGPGFFPLLVGGLLVVLGIVIALQAAVEEGAEPLTAPPWRGLAMLVAALVLFGLTVRGLGLIGATFLAALLAALASRQTSPIGAIVMAAGLTALSWLIFVIGLQLNVPLVGPWIPQF